MSHLSSLVDEAPAAPHFAVSRERLVQQINEATTRRLTMVVAPAGSGKSVALAQWAASTHEGAVAWLRISDADQHGPKLARRLRAALGQLGPQDASTALRGLLKTRSGVLVIEDLDRLQAPDLADEIDDIIEAAPDSLRFIVTSRVDSVLPVHRLRLRDEVTEVRQADLAFDGSEARPLLSALGGHPLSPEQVDVLVARTEGWAAGLQLAALSLRGRDDVDAFVAEFSGDDRHVADYLGNEVLDQLPDDVRRFLLQTSVVDTVTAALCEVLTDEDEASSSAMLGRLSRQGLFVMPLDEQRATYRYHRLFRDLLRLQLRSEHPGLEPRLLRAAGAWHREHDEPDAAADCFIAAEAWDELLALARGFGRTGTAALRQTSVVRWFAALPEQERWATADVALFQATVQVYAGNALATEQLLTEIADRFTLSRGQQGVALALLAFLGQWHLSPDRVIAAATASVAALEGCPADHVPSIAGLTAPDDLRFAMGVSTGRALVHVGDTAGALRELRALRADVAGVHLLYLVHGLGIGAVAEAWSGHLAAAEQVGRQALDVAEEGKLRLDLGTADAHLALATVARERNDLAAAAELLEEALVRAQQNRRHALLAMIRSEQALLALARDEPAKGLRILREARREGHPPVPAGMAARLRAAEATLLLALRDIDGAAHVLGDPGPDQPDATRAAGVLVAIARTDVPSARKQLDAWPPGDSLRMQIDRAILTAIVADIDGQHREARATMAAAVGLAEPEGSIRAFSDIGAHAHRILRRLYRSTPTSFLRSLVEAPDPSRVGRHDSSPTLHEQLSERELAVLRHLPSDMPNTQIAEQLFISVNTLKTHLGHIYTKLGVSSRREAVDRADQLHLI